MVRRHESSQKVPKPGDFYPIKARFGAESGDGNAHPPNSNHACARKIFPKIFFATTTVRAGAASPKSKNHRGKILCERVNSLAGWGLRAGRPRFAARPVRTDAVGACVYGGARLGAPRDGRGLASE